MRRKLYLQLFAEGGGATGTGTAGTATGTTVPASTGTADAPKDSAVSEKKSKNSLKNVVYGKTQQSEPAQQEQVPVQKERTPFEELIKGEYKEDWEKAFQKSFDERIAIQKQADLETSKQLDNMNQVMSMLSAKYGVDANDIKALTKAIEEDDAYYEKEANEKGISVEQLKRMHKMEQENSALRAKMQETMRQDQAQKNIEEWMKQAEEVKKIYPSFDFRTESDNKDFQALIIRGVPVKTAYEVVHNDEIIGGAMQYTAQTVAQKVSNNIQTRAKRPSENGVASNNGIVTKSDVHSLTKADRAEIARRVARGERITF